MEKEVYLWLARDKDGELFLFSHKPHRCTDTGWNNECWDAPNMPSEGESEYIDTLELDPNLFKEITWENEPQKVKLLFEK